MNDLGSKYSFGVFEKITLKAKELALELKVGGAGYLFDQVSNQLTREILYGLLVAILTIGILFFSGSLYTIALMKTFFTDITIVNKIMIPITPLGGSLLIIGWLLVPFKVK